MKKAAFWGLTVLAVAFCIDKSWAQALSGHPASWVPNEMLESLDPQMQAERQPIVDAALAAFPGCGETLLAELISPGFLETSWARSDQQWGPLDAGSQGHAYGYNNRSWGIYSAGGGSTSVILAGQSYIPREMIYTSPLILDLNRDGAAGTLTGVVEPHKGLAVGKDKLVVFDIDGDGFADLTEWVNNTDGLLVAVGPNSPDKVVTGPNGLSWQGPLTGRDLLGTSEGYANGFEKLELRDADSDGSISGQELGGLYLWTDKDSNGIISAGELLTLSELGLSKISLPEPGELVGSATLEGQELDVWDWWPSFAQARKDLPGGPILPPTSVAATGGPETTLQVSFRDVLVLNESGWVSRPGLEAVGIDFRSVTIGYLTPDGSKFILEDRTPNANDIAAGFARRLWVIEKDGANLSAMCVAVPVATVRQLVGDTDESLFVVGNGGAKIIRMDVKTGRYTVLMEPVPQVPGFRAADLARRHSGDVYMTGYLYNEFQEAENDSIVRVNGSAAEGYCFEAVANVEAIRDMVRREGILAEEYMVSGDLGFFVVKTASAVWTLVAYHKGVVSTIDHDVSLRGLAASGSRLLYFKQRPSGSDVEAEVIVYDVCSGERFVLGTGDYCYPYLEGDGSVAVVSSVDWSAGTMTFLSAEVSAGAVLQPMLTTNGIGALRVSDDGRWFGYLGPDGLKLGCTAILEMDLYQDCKIDFRDFALFAAYWLKSDCQAPDWCAGADREPDGDVDFTDLAVLKESWLNGVK